MSDFSSLFASKIDQHCVGKAVVRVEADGCFEHQHEHWLHLEDGTRLTFVTGSHGADSDVLYGLTILSAEGEELVASRRYPPAPYDAIDAPLSLVEPSNPPMRQGFERAIGKTITAAYFSDHAIGVLLDEDAYLVASTAGPLLHAAWLYEGVNENQYQAVAKTIIGAWSQGSSFGLSSSAQDKLC